MPIHKIEFHLPRERGEMIMAQRGAEYLGAITDIIDTLRRWRKHGYDSLKPKPTTPEAMLDAVWDATWNVLRERNIDPVEGL